MRISDWSSDVCSADLRRGGVGVRKQRTGTIHAPNLMAIRRRTTRRLRAGIDWVRRRAHIDPRAYPRIPFLRRGARVVDLDGLENRCSFKGTVGSNPTLSEIGSRSSWEDVCQSV